MASTITVTLPHNLGVEAAKKRVVEQLEKLRRDYVNKVAHSEISWAGDIATVRVTALGQTVTAQITVLKDALRVDVQLPRLLAALSSKVQDLITRNANDVLQIGHTPPKA
jgi:hypothetical protein